MAEPRRRRIENWRAVAALVALAWLVGLVMGIGFANGVRRDVAAPPAGGPDRPGLGTVREAWDIVERDAVDRATLDDRRLAYGAVRGLLQAIGDPYASFQTPGERQAQREDYRGQFEGIGVYLELRDGRVAVSAPIDDGPALRAGIRTGDVVLAIDGASTAGMSLAEAVARIRGPAGTGVGLRIERPDAPAPVELAVERAEVRLVSARGRMAAPAIGVLRIGRFHERTDEEVGNALGALERQGARALVIDLRSNGGGLMGSAGPVAGRFIPAGPVAWQVDGHGEHYAYTPADDRPLVTWPIAVLVDRGTASAAEVVAAALRDAAGAPLVGERTFGKGSVQYLRELGDGAGITLTAARLVSPAGTRFDGVGLDPDVAVGAPPTDSTDPALEQAVQLLRPRLPAHEQPAGSGDRDTRGG